MTLDQLRAIVELLQRTPMTTAERLWTQGVINEELEAAAPGSGVPLAGPAPSFTTEEE